MQVSGQLRALAAWPHAQNVPALAVLQTWWAHSRSEHSAWQHPLPPPDI
jgi:hypothetical protein